MPPDGPQHYSDIYKDGGDLIIAQFNNLIPEGKANARLIAAAPDQNAALLALVSRFNRFLASDRNHADAYNALVKGAYADWEAACAAIAKAEGQS